MISAVETSLGVQLHDVMFQAQDVLCLVFGVIYYPLWLVWALIYGLWPSKIPFQSFFDEHSVQSDAYTQYHSRALAAAKEDEGQKKSVKDPKRDTGRQLVIHKHFSHQRTPTKVFVGGSVVFREYTNQLQPTPTNANLSNHQRK